MVVIKHFRLHMQEMSTTIRNEQQKLRHKGYI